VQTSGLRATLIALTLLTGCAPKSAAPVIRDVCSVHTSTEYAEDYALMQNKRDRGLDVGRRINSVSRAIGRPMSDAFKTR
jgi:hypothetical protein